MNKFTNLIIYLFFSFVIFTPVVLACNEKRNHDSVKITKRDTTESLFLVKSPITGVAEGQFGKKVRVPDTLSWKEDGNKTLKWRGGSDSFYIASFVIEDRDSTGNVKKDSLGRPKFKTTTIDMDKRLIRSGFNDLRSAAKELNDLK